MLKKLLSFTLIFTLATQVTFGSQPELTISSTAAKKQQAKNLKKKIIIAAVVATVAAAGSAIAVANFAPEHYPKVLKKYTPTWLLRKDARTFFEHGESVHDLETNEPSTNTSVNEQKLQYEDLETLIGTLQNEITTLSQAPGADMQLCSHLNGQLKNTLSYQKALQEHPDHKSNFASSLSRHIKNALQDIDTLKQNNNSAQFMNLVNQLAPQMKTFAMNLDNTYGNNENYWLGHKPLTKK
jgi:hypothetical protein